MACCRYNIIKEVGNGTFGSVWRALNKQTGDVVCATFILKTWPLAFYFYTRSSIKHYCQTGCNKKNEEEILFMGGVCKLERSQGKTIFPVFL